ncbi:MAG TPA: ERAP1-like C-terminal domain-containing protein, partial [Thermoanaerobaculia bacterium]
RSLLLAELGGCGDEATIAEARHRFALFLQNAAALRPDLRFPVYRLTVESGGEEDYEAVLAVFRKSDLHEERMRALRALGFTRQAHLLQRTLEFSLSPEVRPQDTPLAIGSVAWNRRGRELAWSFLQSRWEEFNRRYGKGGFLLARLISSTTADFASEERAREVEQFFRLHPAPAAERTIRQSIERIRSNAAWLKRDLKAIEQWLAEHARAQP